MAYNLSSRISSKKMRLGAKMQWEYPLMEWAEQKLSVFKFFIAKRGTGSTL